MEQAKGHSCVTLGTFPAKFAIFNSLIRLRGNNVVTVLMKEKQIDLQTAADEVGVHFGRLMKRFIANRERLPLWSSSVS
jgi:hypothetical protein